MFEKHERRSYRLQNYDYRSTGYYFVTICAYQNFPYFGEIKNGKMVLSPAGKIVYDEWLKTPKIRPYVKLDAFAMMPNHVHGIIVIRDNVINYLNFKRTKTRADNFQSRTNVSRSRRGVLQYAPTGTQRNLNFSPPTKLLPRDFHSPSISIGAIIRGFKSHVTKLINNLNQTPGLPVWQRNYYDHIIRDETALQNIRQYIINNQIIWHRDRNNL